MWVGTHSLSTRFLSTFSELSAVLATRGDHDEADSLRAREADGKTGERSTVTLRAVKGTCVYTEGVSYGVLCRNHTGGDLRGQEQLPDDTSRNSTSCR